MTKGLPSKAVLRRLLDYDPATGVFGWKVRRRGRPLSRAGGEESGRYRRIKIDGRYYYEHRLAFVWMTGRCPNLVDHRNRRKSDNRWSNLRASTKSLNSYNSARSDRTSTNRTSGEN